MIALAQAVRTAMLQQIASAIDSGSLPGRLQFYSGARPLPGGAPSGALQASVPLSKPCASVQDAVLTFTGNVEGQRVAEDTIAWARFTNSDGVYVMDASVSGSGGTGDIVISNVNGYAGAFVRLTSGVMGL